MSKQPLLIAALLALSTTLPVYGETPQTLTRPKTTPSEKPSDNSRNRSPTVLEFDYPELLVSPPASQRLKMESQREKKDGALLEWIPLQLGAVASIFSGLGAMRDQGKPPTATENYKDSVKFSGQIAVLNGLGWLGATAALSVISQPYQSGWRDIQKLPQGSKQDRLTRERLAEEALEAPSNLAKRLSYVALGTNSLSAGLILRSANDPLTKILAASQVLLAATPFIFPSRWQEVFNQHLEYKKRIYGPIAQVSLWQTNEVFPAQQTDSIELASIRPGPTMHLTWNF